MRGWQKSHNSESVWGATLYKTLEVGRTLWSFSFSCSGNSLGQTLDRILVRIFRVTGDRQNELGRTLVSEGDS